MKNENQVNDEQNRISYFIKSFIGNSKRDVSVYYNCKLCGEYDEIIIRKMNDDGYTCKEDIVVSFPKNLNIEDNDLRDTIILIKNKAESMGGSFNISITKTSSSDKCDTKEFCDFFAEKACEAFRVPKQLLNNSSTDSHDQATLKNQDEINQPIIIKADGENIRVFARDECDYWVLDAEPIPKEYNHIVSTHIPNYNCVLIGIGIGTDNQSWLVGFRSDSLHTVSQINEYLAKENAEKTPVMFAITVNKNQI